jgi:CopG family nickel-responsive transcriptional regulator
MRGPVNVVRNTANAIMAERGVRHGKLNMVPIDVSEVSHTHGGQPHVHSRPLT